MWLPALVCLLGLFLRGEAVIDCTTHPTFRAPRNTDITVMCGTQRLELCILLCPVYFAGYNESLMALNSQHSSLDCHGTPDWSVDPPTLKFNFTISESSISTCNNKLKITQEVGSGLFSDYSSIQAVNISGIISSLDPSAGTITYRQEMTYMYSCRYPLQYLINNTEMSVTGVSLAIKDNNGSFISTLSMQLFEDRFYKVPLVIPSFGLQLKKRIFVEVKATNLTDRFYVLLDRCYATTTPFPVNSSYYDLFVGCTRDGQTVMGANGERQSAQFSFEAFRFVEHKNMTVSTFYLHCATRLCERTACVTVRPNCTGSARRRREVPSSPGTAVSEAATVTSGPIITRVDSGIPEASSFAGTASLASSRSLAGVAIATGALGVICVSLVGFIIFKIRSSKLKPGGAAGK
ncbi:zona pellucida-like domain-containing protein 1 isoform X2 [Lepisosteus oculatus]|uniref:zona pellucida-like domain-containing protein 1 isoform X2 n=1 Tax=Lepisosteus oculatus TaxID=7918 RepID=UPI00073FD4D0|nr:PREDICTED: zona pellucida-like domain-containing protein 1 isoform X2 [Lepisosteus oculatus]